MAAGLLTAGLLAVPAATASAQSVVISHAPMHRVALGSSNWSGYVRTGATFHAATAKWTVPKVAATAGNTFSASWVGIDGFSNSNLIQTGTESDFVGGAAQYDAWWEILPAAETPVFKVKPGDVMTAAVKKVSGTTWSIRITDTTSGKSFSAQKRYTGAGTSAEWIQERPLVNGALATLAHYGKVVFDPLTANGASANLKPAGRILMLNAAGTKILSNPSAPDPKKDGFRVAFGSAQPAPPAT